jgi:hypothetical protein
MTTPASKHHISVRRNNKTGGPFFRARTNADDEADRQNRFEYLERKWGRVSYEARQWLQSAEGREYQNLCEERDREQEREREKQEQKDWEAESRARREAEVRKAYARGYIEDEAQKKLSQG